MNKLSLIEYKDIRVLTTEQLAEVYETDVNNIQMNFSNNKDRFIEGIHYYFLQGDDLKAFKSLPNDIGLPINKFTSQLYLWTERGASRHCKILDTNEAWKQFDYLEDTYFKIKSSPEIIEQLNNTILELQQKFNILENSIDIKIQMLMQQGLENHRPSHKTKLDWYKVIKRYAVCKGDEEALKQFVLVEFNANKWEDIPYYKSYEVLQYIRYLAKKLEMFSQISLLEK